MDTIYQRLVAIGAEVSNHASDLHVKRTPEVDEVLRVHRDECVERGEQPPLTKRFINEVTRELWYEVLFSFDPWWQARRPAGGV